MLGFTRQEQQIVLFLTVSLLIGSFLKIYESLQESVSVAPVPRAQIEAFSKHADSLEQATAERERGAEVEMLSASKMPVSSRTNLSASAQPSATENALFVDVNSAGVEELQTIPGIGPVLAQRIIDYRTRIGAFGHINELKEVKGIGEKTFEKIKPYVSLKE